MVEVVGADLEQLVAGALVQPLRDLLVQLGARALRETRVRDVADQDVLEAVRGLAGDRGAALAHDEVAQRAGRRAPARGPRSRAAACTTAPSQKIRPMTAARWSSIFSFRGRRSMRAAIIACSVSGIRFAERRRPRAASASSPRRRADCPRSSRAAPAAPTSRAGGRRAARRRAPRSPRARAARARSRWRERGRRPSRAEVEQLGPSEADDQERRLTDAVGEVLDQLEQGLLGPVDVLEDEDRAAARRPARRPTRAPPRRSPAGCARSRRLEHARREPEQVGDRVVAAACAQLLDRLLDGVVVRDAGGDLDHLSERPVRDALAVRQRAPGEDGGALDSLDELAREAALADAGLAVDREQVRALVPHDAREVVFEQLELVLATDERHRDRGHAAVALTEADEAATGMARRSRGGRACRAPRAR